MVACLNALAASSACPVMDRWFSLPFSLVAEFRLHQWTAEVLCQGVTQPLGGSSSSEVGQDIGDLYRGGVGDSSP